MDQTTFIFKKLLNKYMVWQSTFFHLSICKRVLENMYNNSLMALFNVDFIFFPLECMVCFQAVRTF